MKYSHNNRKESARFENIREEADYGATGENGYGVVDGKVQKLLVTAWQQRQSPTRPVDIYINIMHRVGVRRRGGYWSVLRPA